MKAIVYFVAALFLLSSLFLAPSLVPHLMQKDTQEKEVIIVKTVTPDEEKAYAYKHELVGWVYNNSSRISYKTATIIVEEILKYEQPILLLSLIQAESEFSPTAISSVGAQGLGQIRWSIWGRSLIEADIAKGPRELYDIDVAVRATYFIFNKLYEQNKRQLIPTLEAYVGGPHKAYIDKITRNFIILSMMKKGI